MDRKVRRAQERCDRDNAPRAVDAAGQARIDALEAQVKAALEAAQAAGEEGDVDQSLVLAQQAEALAAALGRLRAELTLPDKTMTVCEVCCVYIASNDSEARKQARRRPPPPAPTRSAPHRLRFHSTGRCLGDGAEGGSGPVSDRPAAAGRRCTAA